MYVTDRPVMDRLTDPTWRELWPAFASLEERTMDLILTAEDAVKDYAAKCDGECGNTTAPAVQMTLSQVVSGALAAQEHMAEALALVGVEPL